MNRTTVIVAAVLLVLGAAATLLWVDRERRAEWAELQQTALAQGMAAHEDKNYVLALEELEKIPPGAVTDWQVPYYIGSSHMLLKDYTASAAALEQALALNPDDPGTLYALGVVYYKLGNLKLSKSYFAAVLEINPDDQHAKGLMDIMANLERQQPGNDGGEGPAVNPEQPDS